MITSSERKKIEGVDFHIRTVQKRSKTQSDQSQRALGDGIFFRKENAVKWKNSCEKSEKQPKKQSEKGSRLLEATMLREYLTGMDQLKPRGLAPKHLTSSRAFGRRMASRHKERKQHTRMDAVKYKQCCRLADQIYDHMATLNQLGYLMEKIEAWVGEHCKSCYLHLRDLFHHNSFTSLASNQDSFQFQRERAIVKQRMQYQMTMVSKEKIFVEVSQLQSLCAYLETMIIERNHFKLKQVQDQICSLLRDCVPIGRSKFSGSVEREMPSLEDRIREYETNQCCRWLGRVDRARFQQLGEVEQRLMMQYERADQKYLHL